MTVRFNIPGRTQNTGNQALRGHWAPKARQAKAERAKAMLLCPKWTGSPLLVVFMVRHSPREMDDDGLRSALKHVRDGIAARLRIDDGSPLVRWNYSQGKCKAGEERVGVTIETVSPVISGTCLECMREEET